MIEQNTQLKVNINQLTPQFSKDLRKHTFFAGADILNQGLFYNVLQSIKFSPHVTRLVAYDTEKKKAVGFISLEENTNTLYSIKYVFVDPEYRKAGIASRLLNTAFAVAKTKGATKVNLNVYITSTNAIALYKKLGFREIGYTILGQGYPSNFKPNKTIKRFIIGQGKLSYLGIEKESRLFQIQDNLKNRKKLFEIYKRCIQQQWIDFFEVKPDTIINGSRQVWQPSFFRNILINDLGNSFAFIFNRPFSNKATVELYSTSAAFVPSVLEDILRILSNRGIPFAQIWLFHPNTEVAFNWFEKKGFKIFQFVGMGKTLIENPLEEMDHKSLI